MSSEREREQVIVRTSVIGILANIVLVVFKALVGLASGSIAIILDAVNNLTDALSSVITIVGTDTKTGKDFLNKNFKSADAKLFPASF